MLVEKSIPGTPGRLSIYESSSWARHGRSEQNVNDVVASTHNVT